LNTHLQESYEKLVESHKAFISGANDFMYPQEYNNSITKNNEMLFFIKPEIATLANDDYGNALKEIFKRFETFDVSVTGIKMVNGNYIGKYNVIANHYGFINKVARLGIKAITSEGKSVFKEKFGVSMDDVEFLGAFEVIDKYSYFTPESFCCLWDNLVPTKLSGGTYCEKLNLLGTIVYALNGFHPYQLLHFTKPESAIHVLTVQSDKSWKSLRENLIGSTMPEKADKDSIRGYLCNNYEQFNINEISKTYNGVHLSAGPIEAIKEIGRFFSKPEEEKTLSIADIGLGKKFLDADIPEDLLSAFIENPSVTYNDTSSNPFDLTEEMDASECISFLKENTLKIDQ